MAMVSGRIWLRFVVLALILCLRACRAFRLNEVAEVLSKPASSACW